jgi:ferric-dicitrate binding protein FerR (iron transport regulator)
MLQVENLIEKFADGSILPKERADLKAWVRESDEHKKHFKKRLLIYDQTHSESFDASLALQSFTRHRIQKNKARKSRFRTFYKYAAVISGLVLVGFMGLHFINEKNSAPVGIDVTTAKTPEKEKHIQILLADGTHQKITDKKEQTITNAQGAIVANSKSSMLRFTTTGVKEEKLTFNEINVPYGKKLKIELSDGSVVWLNAGSKFKFPQQFMATEKNRTVYLRGEAFFEVAKDKKHPFIVNTGGIKVAVLGTKFNVSSYATNTAVATTLVEGSVALSSDAGDGAKIFLNPREQAQFDAKSHAFSKKVVDTEIYTAWIQDKFIISNLSFTEILRRLERMHDVEISNNANDLNKELFKGEFADVDIKTILTTMTMSVPFNFKIEGRKITITDK